MTQMQLDGMPRRLFVCTPSRLATYADCPRKYRMTYLDRPAPPKGPPRARTSFGLSIHNGLRRWWDESIARRTPRVAAQLLRASWVEEGWRDAEQSRRCQDAAADMVARYAATLDPACDPVGVERTVAARTDRLALSGRVDRLDERGGELVVVDYKTGRTPPTDIDARASQALAIYAFAAGRTLRAPCRRVELHHVPTGTIGVAEHDDASIARHLRRAESIASDAESAAVQLRAGGDADELFPATPGPLCGWCDLRGHCPQGQQAAPARAPWDGIDDVPGLAGPDRP
jgi:putative RecB family exonuclease